jgi:1-hydroxycarotenoid 3,4-desaturase
MTRAPLSIVVIGAGFGGLAAAIRLQAAGHAVTLLEAAPAVGGKARVVPSEAGPVDTGPTVLTLRGVFDDLFALAGARLDDHVRLVPQPILARHWWPDGATLDLTPDRDANIAAIAGMAGAAEARAFARFDALAENLRAAFAAPVMEAPAPRLLPVVRAALARPGLWGALRPGLSFDALLRAHFRDPRLIQLFGRYATYVGGLPAQVPAVLAIIWRAEAAGVWAVEGGMHGLARALADLFVGLGGRLHLSSRVTGLRFAGGRVSGVEVGRDTLPGDAVVFNGDPAALATGLLGPGAHAAVPLSGIAPRSLSAHVWAFAARPRGAALVHHNVFFTADAATEFGPLAEGRLPQARTVYVCAEDRGGLPGSVRNDGPERFEMILNAPPGLADDTTLEDQCRSSTFSTLRACGLTFDREPASSALTTPMGFARLFPASAGAIYGRSPAGTLATFLRPLATTALPGLYLAGGGCHPGAGVPMAALSGRHAAAAIMSGRISPSHPGRTAMPGGMSTPSATTAAAPLASSAS